METRIADLEARVAALERRIGALERPARSPEEAPGALGVPSFGGEFLANSATRVGKVLLIFGGAYLLRSITDSGLVPTGFGILLGALYALLWMVVALRAAADEVHRTAAVFYGGASILLALPLAIEATTRFAILTGPQAVVAATAFCLLALAVAAARELRSLAWLATAGGIATVLALVNASRAAVPVALSLLVLGLASLAVVYRRRWLGLQWLGAAGANSGAMILLLLAGSPQWSLGARTVLGVAAALLVTYLAAFALRSHRLGQRIGWFEAVQTVSAGAIVAWAARFAAGAGVPVLAPLGGAALALGAGACALALARVTRTQRGRNFYFYATLALALIIAGSAVLLRPGVAAAAWSLLALGLAWTSGRTGRVTLSLFATVLLLAAAAASGILVAGWRALAGDPGAGWPTPNAWHVVVAASTVACLFVPVAQRSQRWGALAKLPQLLVLALSVCGVGGLIVVYAAPLVAGIGGLAPNPATLAALRTGVLSAASVTLAISSRFARWPEARWLVYPVLALVGLKLFAEDFPHGEPLTLFVALGLVGGALIVVARLLRREPSA